MAVLHPLSRPIAAAIAAVGLLSLAPAALAQSAAGTDPTRAPRVNAAEGFGTTDTSGGIFGDNASPFDLIHRVTLMNGTSMSDFSRQHRGRISNEAQNFQTLREQALRRQAQPEATETTPETGAE
ncbi:hypothetical protein [Nodosilinea sp. E11]|uniref:hypothetical protein n=1 Tax=Nodosilinea sp. E11 TaxID=3037479 RepID=UPI0029344E08|nr:hypothetical protein [Nodosilinea sp. E11]WOD38034.1 hypothetical protein RRF56_17625 [Nodosilinea sp. E11]